MHTLTEAEWVQVFYYCGLESSAATEAAREYRGEFYDYEPGYALVRHIQTKNGYVGRWVHTVTNAQLDSYLKKLRFRDEAVAWAKYPEAGLPYREVHSNLQSPRIISVATCSYTAARGNGQPWKHIPGNNDFGRHPRRIVQIPPPCLGP